MGKRGEGGGKVRGRSPRDKVRIVRLTKAQLVGGGRRSGEGERRGEGRGG